MEDFPSCRSSGFTPNLGSPYPGRRLFLLPRLMRKSFDFCQEPNRKSQICKLAYICKHFCLFTILQSQNGSKLTGNCGKNWFGKTQKITKKQFQRLWGDDGRT